MGYEQRIQVDAEIDFSVDNDNAEVDALQGTEPNWLLFRTDRCYRRRYFAALWEANLGDVSVSLIQSMLQTRKAQIEVRQEGAVKLIDDSGVCEEF